MSSAVSRPSPRRILSYSLPVILTALLTFLALITPMLSQLISPTLEVGDVAPQDYRAPRSITYVSEEMTEQRREAAARAVETRYTPPSTTIARQQLEKLRGSLAFINSVRADKHASNKQKLEDLSALDEIQLGPETANAILAMSDSRWQAVHQEAISVLENVMRTTIRSDRLEEARSTVSNQVSLSLSEQQASIVAELAAAFVVPNSLPSESLTEQARQAAREAVQPFNRTFIAGQTVVSRGQVLTAADVEALQALGLGLPQQRWQDYLAPAVVTVLVISLIAGYLWYAPNPVLLEARSLALVIALFLSFLFGARLIIPNHTILPYAFPLAAFSLVIASLFGSRLALFFSLPLSVLAAYDLPNALDLTLYYTFSAFFGILALGRARRVLSFFRAGAGIAIAGSLVIWAYRLPLPSTDWIGIASLTATALFNGLAAASLTLLLQFFLAQFLGLTTPMQLMELTRPDHPLLQLLLREAPGTYQHSLQVANLAEQASEQIGANILLTRVGALYHDVGKINNPIFFIENQVAGILNPHDDLDPLTSAQTIIRHVTDGLELGRKYHLPKQILAFISEHHGTMATRYQYVKAVQAAGGDESLVDMDLFRYPGPRPQSRETAILLLADGCEARIRAEKPKDEDELRSLIKDTIDTRVAMGQLDDTGLTLRDLSRIVDSFTATLRGIYHPRVVYPKLEKGAEQEEGENDDAGVLQDLRGQELPTRPVSSHFDEQSIPEAAVRSHADSQVNPN